MVEAAGPVELVGAAAGAAVGAKGRFVGAGAGDGLVVGGAVGRGALLCVCVGKGSGLGEGVVLGGGRSVTVETGSVEVEVDVEGVVGGESEMPATATPDAASAAPASREATRAAGGRARSL